LAVFFCCRARATGRARQSAKTQLRERARGVTGARVTGARERGRDKGFWLVATKISREINSRRRPCARDSRVAPALCSAGGRRPCSLLLPAALCSGGPARPLLPRWPAAQPSASCSRRRPSAPVRSPSAPRWLAICGSAPARPLFLQVPGRSALCSGVCSRRLPSPPAALCSSRWPALC